MNEIDKDTGIIEESAEENDELEFSVDVKECFGGGLSIHTWYEYDDIEGLIKLLQEKGVKSVDLEYLDFLDSTNRHKSVSTEALTQADLDWVDKSVIYQSRYLRLRAR